MGIYILCYLILSFYYSSEGNVVLLTPLHLIDSCSDILDFIHSLNNIKLLLTSQLQSNDIIV